MEAVRLTVTIKGQDSKILLSQHVDVPVCKAAETAADLGKTSRGFTGNRSGSAKTRSKCRASRQANRSTVRAWSR